MPVLVGVVLALAVGAFGTTVGLDRDRAFYPTVTVVVALYYCLFAVMGGSSHALLLETAAAGVFIVAAALGFRGSLWIVAAALAGHGILDIAHGRLVANPGVPAWWPGFCSAFDLVAAGYLAWRLGTGHVRATRPA